MATPNTPKFQVGDKIILNEEAKKHDVLQDKRIIVGQVVGYHTNPPPRRAADPFKVDWIVHHNILVVSWLVEMEHVEGVTHVWLTEVSENWIKKI